MSFTDPPFLILFAVVFGLWLACRHSERASVFLLLTGSVVFYGYHQQWLLLLLLTYCLVNWAVGCLIERGCWPRTALTVGVGFNLLVLAYWKYTPLLLRTFSQAPVENWMIPFGISFYAFTGIAYMVDVYRRTAPAETSFWRYTLSATFFPHLVAGPILRPNDFLNRLRPGNLPTRPEAPLEALLLLGRGYFKKAVLADRLALAIDPFFSHVSDPTTTGVWALPYVYLYALQIYFDFSGYTDIARGLGLLFGYRWPDNFNLPYLATSVQDFWRRWHMTLSLFLKDYLYIPLGGSRGGWWRTNVNLMATMLLGGLWHGASWSFLLWGGLHGGFLVVHRFWTASRIGRWVNTWTGPAAWLWKVVSVAITFHCVCLAWCFFRLTVWRDSLVCVRKWFVFDPEKAFVGGAADGSLWLLLAVYGLLVWAVTRFGRVPEWDELGRRPVWTPLARGFLWGGAVGLLLLATVLSPGGEKPPFIYFQF